jgi:hypothetical protein
MVRKKGIREAADPGRKRKALVFRPGPPSKPNLNSHPKGRSAKMKPMKAHVEKTASMIVSVQRYPQ